MDFRHKCIRWPNVVVMGEVIERMMANQWKGCGHYVRFGNFMDEEYDYWRIYYCPVCSEKLD